MTSLNPDLLSVNHLLESIATDKTSKPPVNIEAIAKSIGAEITYEQMFCDGSLEEIGQNKYLIKVNEKSNRLRQRFTIAHEIAHVILRTGDRTKISSFLEKNYPKREGFVIDWSDEEKICDLISASLLVPPSIARLFSDWKSFSIQKVARASREWQVSLSTFLWSVFAIAQYEGGFIWYKTARGLDDTSDICLNHWWSKFPKSQKIYIPKTVFLRVSNPINLNYSLVDFSRNEERFHPRVKFEFEGLSEYRAMRIKAFGKGKEKKVLVIVYPKEIKPKLIMSTNSMQRTIV